MADVSAIARPEDWPMQILIELDRADPPAGTVRVAALDDAATREGDRFVGWLGLLRALGSAVSPAKPPSELER